MSLCCTFLKIILLFSSCVILKEYLLEVVYHNSAHHFRKNIVFKVLNDRYETTTRISMHDLWPQQCLKKSKNLHN